MTGQQDIDVAGTLQNMLDQGFSINDCVGEEFDNSNDATSRRIQAHLLTEQNLLIYADNGRGMDRVELKAGFKLNKRSEATNQKQGRYGIGGKQAKVNFTKLQHATVTISKKSGNPAINAIEVDWKECVLENTYCNRATGASREYEELFKKYVQDGLNSDSGTLHIIPCAKESFNEIRNGVESKSVIKSWLYDFGVKYHDAIRKGVRIEFIIDGTTYEIIPIDPLAFENTPDQHKFREIVEFYQNPTGNLCAWLPERNSQLQEKKKGRGTRIEPSNEALLPEWQFVCRTMMEFTYVENPEVKIATLIENGFLDRIVSEDAKANIRYEQNATAYLNGVFFNRNDKIIHHFENPRPKSGDKARYPYVNKSSCRVTFGVEMDSLFSVQVNKSTLKEELIHPTVRKAYTYLLNEFVDNQYSIYKAQRAAFENDSDDAESIHVHEHDPDPEPVVPESDDEGFAVAIEPVVVAQHRRIYVGKEEALQIIEDIHYIIEDPAQDKEFIIEELSKILATTIGKGGNPQAIMQWKVAAQFAGVQCILHVLEQSYKTWYADDGANVIAGSCLYNLRQSLAENR